MNEFAQQNPVIIVNPASGGGRCRKRLPAFRASAEKRLQNTAGASWLMTERAGHAHELARDLYRQGRRVFWAVGGDGTAYEVVNGLFEATESPEAELAIIPLGTGNSFLRQFGIESGEAALDAITAGSRMNVDVVRLEHADGVLYSINLICLGLAARVGDLTNRRFKSLGALGYVAAVLTCLIKPEAPTLSYRLDGGKQVDSPSTMLAFCNSSYTGGAMYIAPRASIDDGKLDAIRLDAISRFKLLGAFPGIFKGTHVNQPFVDYQHATEVTFDLNEPQKVLIDGEIIDLQVKNLKVLPGRLSIIGQASQGK